MVTLALAGPLPGWPFNAIFSITFLNGSTDRSSISPKTTYLPSSDITNVTDRPATLSVPDFAPLIFEAWRSFTSTCALGGTFALRR